jgi:hypothetical protein
MARKSIIATDSRQSYCLRVGLKLYQENDKIMLLATGEVFTVLADFSESNKPGIFVKEKVIPALDHGEVRPAGRTRERADAGIGIVDPEPAPPRPANSLL